MISAGLALVGRGHAEGCTGFEGDDTVQLPASDEAARHSVAVENATTLANRQIPNRIANEPMLYVKWGVAPLQGIVVGHSRVEPRVKLST
jgi:hypothetical protein